MIPAYIPCIRRSILRQKSYPGAERDSVSCSRALHWGVYSILANTGAWMWDSTAIKKLTHGNNASFSMLTVSPADDLSPFDFRHISCTAIRNVHIVIFTCKDFAQPETVNWRQCEGLKCLPSIMFCSFFWSNIRIFTVSAFLVILNNLSHHFRWHLWSDSSNWFTWGNCYRATGAAIHHT